MKRALFVRSMEKSVCPICMGKLEVIGSRRRYVIEGTGSRQTLIVRRMRCLNSVCRKIHHELPDILVPYKIHAAEILEKIIEKDTQEVPLEESTIHRIRSWFYHRADALVGGLIGVYIPCSIRVLGLICPRFPDPYSQGYISLWISLQVG